MEKEDIQNKLLKIGRSIIQEKGAEGLTARKLSEASGCSVGAIYNQFSNMENFVVIQNYMTLEALAEALDKNKETENPYADLNALVQSFVSFVKNNKNLWYLLYSFHLRQNYRTYSTFYLRKVAKIAGKLNSCLQRAVPEVAGPERLLSGQILWLSLFAVSSFLTKDALADLSRADDNTICQILTNTYVAGLTVLADKAKS
ncbi:MAG: TetR/AcrR family transcriptional regulator [Alphaproteobacteria bacterium]|nr:TetR/AcrR family transcriptional regulator [Alphaproteobacteria bacterium]